MDRDTRSATQNAAVFAITRQWAARTALAMLLTSLAVVTSANGQAVYEVVTAFDARFPNGADPYARLIQASDGSFYGTTHVGGTLGVGTVFKIDVMGTLTTLHSFTKSDGRYPAGSLIQASDGQFYGTTEQGGAVGTGTVFKMNAGGTLTTLHSFASFASGEGANPKGELIQASDGNLYGTTYSGGAFGRGTVFKMDAAGTLTTLHSFSSAEGANPWVGLIQATDGNFYGTTTRGGAFDYGTVFKMGSDGTLTTVLSFSGSNGVAPHAALIQASDGSFYGTTTYGGEFGYGTVFKMNAVGTLTTLFSFSWGINGVYPEAGLIEASDGAFYGTTAQGGASGRGTIFTIDAAGILTTLSSFSSSNGAFPCASLIHATDATFYGTTREGGTWGFGTVFKMDAAGTLTTLHSFSSSGDGVNPSAGLIEAKDGSFYGTTVLGGTFDRGTVFKVDAAGTLTTLHRFTSSEGANPHARLTQAGDGSFYSTTYSGGAFGRGTVFKMDAAGTLTTLHSFTSAEGTNPWAGLIQATDGSFYGTTVQGGAFGYGTVFKMDPAGTLTTLVSFSSSNGANPYGTLIQASDGTFYGTTYFGGASGFGTVFKVDSVGTLTTLLSFSGSDGANPYAGVIEASDGSFYGTTYYGGAFGRGTVFKIDAAGTLTTLYSFTVSSGGFPHAGLIQASDGSFYGTTQGTVFGMDAVGTLTTLHRFAQPSGNYTFAGVIQASDSSFYGTTADGGSHDAGVVFRVTLLNSPVTNPESYTSSEDTMLIVTAPGVLANDTDADDDVLSALRVTGPSHGALTLSANGSFTYTPAADYSGPDTFTYMANDGVLDSNVATVSIMVTPVNDAPTAEGETVTTPEDTGKSIALTGFDADGDSLTYSIVDGPSHGTLTGIAPDVTYAPTANYNGPDSFTFKVNDGMVDSSVATVSITVAAMNDAPVANGQSATTPEDTAGPIMLSGADVDGDSLTYAVVDDPSHGTLTGTAPNLTYTPTSNYNGPDSFTFRASDGMLYSTVATVSITVTAVNDGPVATGQSVTTAEDTATAIVLSASDVDGDALTYSIIVSPSHGVLSGTAPNVTYTPAANYTGTDSFSYKVNDGQVDSNTAPITVTIASNHPPNTPSGNNVVTVPVANGGATPVTIEFDNVVAGGETTLTIAPTGPPTPAGFRIGSPPVYYYLETTAAFSGSATVCINYTGIRYENGSLQLFHYEDGDWVPQPTSLLDATNSTICASVTSFSPFALFEPSYVFTGFFSPVDNEAINATKAGSAVPIKFSLQGDFGLSIMAQGYPRSTLVACDSFASTGVIGETVNAGSSSLSYDPLSDRYTYVWKTEKSWTGCRQLDVRLYDGSTYTAYFKFLK